MSRQRKVGPTEAPDQTLERVHHENYVHRSCWPACNCCLCCQCSNYATPGWSSQTRDASEAGGSRHGNQADCSGCEGNAGDATDDHKAQATADRNRT